MSIFAPFCTLAEVNPMVAAYAQSPLLLLLAPLHLLSLSPRHYLILRGEDSLPHHRTLNSSISSLNYYTYSFQVCGKIPTFFQGQRKWLYFLQQTATTCILCKNLETRKSNFIDMKMNLFSRNTASEKRLIFVSMAISKSKGALGTRVPTFVSNFFNFMQFSGENYQNNRLGIDAPSPFGEILDLDGNVQISSKVLLYKLTNFILSKFQPNKTT